MTDKKEEKTKAATEPVEEKKPEDKFFGKLINSLYLILCRAQKESRSPRESFSGQRFQNHSFFNQEPKEIEEDV